MTAPAYRFGVRRAVDKILPPIWQDKAHGVRVIICRARLVCGHIVRREYEIKRSARCYECGLRR